jgi:hypothetical protein
LSLGTRGSDLGEEWPNPRSWRPYKLDSALPFRGVTEKRERSLYSMAKELIAINDKKKEIDGRFG